METSYLIVFSVVSVCIVISLVLTTFVLWARQIGLQDLADERWKSICEKAEPEQIQKAVSIAESSAARMDTATLQLGKFKEGVHSEMQRFYGIMRRNEKTLDQEDQPTAVAEAFPSEISATDLKPREAEGEEISKTELRRQAREAGMKI